MKLKEISTTSTFAWSADTLPLIATGTVAGAVDADFSAQAQLQIWDVFGPESVIFSASVDSRFHALAWSAPAAQRPRGLLVAAYEDASVEFYDVQQLIASKNLSASRVHRSTRHSGPARCLAFNPHAPHVLVAGGANGEIFIWDTTTFDDPTTPGKAMTPIDEVTSVAWNNAVGHILATTSNGGYTSIWDLKAKREVLHLSYHGDAGRANFSYVAWHPTQSTKLVTASDADSCPLILTWDLRNSNEPENVMSGHKKGVLSLDWCAQDPELLLSSGKDNATMLWNPLKGVKLGEYPTTANWAFLTKFAPSAPDVFATASFDGKVSIQSLQDTSPPVSVKVASNNDDEFWNELSTTDTQQPVFDVKQAPAWLKRTNSVSFGFGSKLVIVAKDSAGKSTVNVTKFINKSNLQGETTKFSKALDSSDFSSIIDEKLSSATEHIEKSDWELLKKLSSQDKDSFFAEAIKDPEEISNGSAENEPKDIKKDVKPPSETDDSFFANLSSGTAQETTDIYTPSGSFKLYGSNVAADNKKLTKLVLSNKAEKAIDECLKADKLIEALILALDGPKEYKDKVKNAYFAKNKDSHLARVLYSASSKNTTDLVGNADVSDWRDIARSVGAFSTDKDDYNRKIVELGDRVLASNSKSDETRDNAILLYLAGGALDKISTIWLKELPIYEARLLESTDNEKISSPSDARFEALNNFVTKISAYRAISHTTGSFSGPAAEPLCKAIFEYSNLLAGFGAFDLADRFLKMLPDDFAGLKTDIDRITRASSVNSADVGKSSTQKSYTRATHAKPSTSPFLTKAPLNNNAPLTNPAASLSSTNPYVSSGNSYAPPQPNSSFTPVSNSYTPPVSNSYAPPVTNAYAPPANNFGPTNTFSPSNSISAPAAPSNPYAKPQGHSNPYAPSNPYLNSPVANNNVALAPPPTAPPKPTYKQETEGWNDLPDAFKPKAAPRRAAPPSTVSTSQGSFSGPSGRRPGIASPPPQAGPGSVSAPPKGPSRSVSKSSMPVSSPLPTEQLPVNSRYAPPPSAQPAMPITPNVTSPVVAPLSPLIAAKNPYAPPQPAQNHAALKNPYAPPPSNIATPTGPRTPGSTGGILPPPRAGIVAPPPAVGLNGPPAAAGLNGPPPAASVLSQSPAATPEPPKESKHPPGDRSHISAEARPIFETLSAVYAELEPKIPAKFAAHGKDMKKRLDILYDHLNNDELLSKDGLSALKEICSSLTNKDYPNARVLVLDFASNHPDEIGHWHIGVKRLVNMAEAIP